MDDILRARLELRRERNRAVLDFTVADVEAAGARLEGAIESYAWGRQATLSDPFGHGFCLLQLSERGYDAAV